MATAELVDLGVMNIQLGDFTEVGEGAKGTRLIVDVKEVTLESDRVKASLSSNGSADAGTVSDNGRLLALDVRFTLKTDDGAFIYVEYAGRASLETGLIAIAPTFETGSEKYSWLNGVQAAGAGQANLETGELVYRLYELKVTA
jgi:hypothetical protein|tara:strand:+ start:935 stop:1366 length:432 start_codon:yes stop_codon:yes gene_type:complete